MPEEIKTKPIYDNIEFDSQEEIEFYCWCKELKENNTIDFFVYHHKSYILSDKKTQLIYNKKGTPKEIHLLHPHTYTPDFEISLDPFNFSQDINFFIKAGFKVINNIDTYPNLPPRIIIDTKGTYNKFESERVFRVNQKWLYDKYNIYVNKVVPIHLFRKTFVPSAVAYGKRGELFKRFEGCKIGFSS